jgi:hypothetical protein
MFSPGRAVATVSSKTSRTRAARDSQRPATPQPKASERHVWESAQTERFLTVTWTDGGLDKLNCSGVVDSQVDYYLDDPAKRCTRPHAVPGPATKTVTLGDMPDGASSLYFARVSMAVRQSVTQPSTSRRRRSFSCRVSPHFLYGSSICCVARPSGQGVNWSGHSSTSAWSQQRAQIYSTLLAAACLHRSVELLT